MDSENLIEIDNLSIGYSTGRRERREICIASGLSGGVRAGALTALLGPNGAGKSTLIRTLTAYQPALKGEISLCGLPLSSYSSSELAKNIGVVLTERANAGALTVRELVAVGRTPYTGFMGTLRQEDYAVVDDALRAVGIEEMANRKCNTLSDGEAQKMMIAKVLAQQTPVIVLDEPTAFLDYPSKVEMMWLLRTLAHEQNKAILISTHDMEIALQTADSLWLMSRQHGMATGSPETLSSDGTIARYFSSPRLTYDAASRHFTIGSDFSFGSDLEIASP